MKKTVSVNNDREIAFDILMRVCKGVFLKDSMREAFEKHPELDARSRSFITALCEGVWERRITLDHLIERHSKTPIKKIKPQILTILRMGIYQLKYMDHIPDRAAVNESVTLAKKRGFTPLSGYVNGVLRSVSADTFDASMCEDLSVRYSVPEWLIGLFTENYGREKTALMLEAGLGRQTLYGRVCPGVDPEQLCGMLKDEGILAGQSEVLPGAIVIDESGALSASRCFSRGLFTIQDLSSQLCSLVAARSLGATGEESELRILDMCAAPGGKSVCMAQLLGPRAIIVSRDVSEKKLNSISENLDRLHIENVDAQVFDATVFDESSEGGFDLVLADLPCSGLGVLGRKKDIKYRVTPEDLTELSALQKRILDNAVRYVKKGGLLLYSTCTVNPGENTDQVSYLIEKYGFEPVSFEEWIPEAFRERGAGKGALQLLSGVDPCDGFFISLLRR